MLKLFNAIVMGLLLTSLVSCASTHGSLTPQLKDELLTRFASGDIKQECGSLSCAGGWGYNRNKLKALHDSGQYQKLALEVLSLGFGDDLAWYYLGRAAEGLGYTEAALKYYRISIYGPLIGPRCAGFLNVCDGFDLPELSKTRLSKLINDQQKQALSPRQATEPPRAVAKTPDPIPSPPPLKPLKRTGPILGKVVAVQNPDVFEIDLGTENGIERENQGRAFYTISVDGQEKRIYVAKIVITHVSQKTSTARVTDKTAEVHHAYTVEVE